MYAGVCLYTFGLSKTGNAFYFSRFSLTKRMVQGGEATSERRRRDGVSCKSHLRGLSSLLKNTPCRLTATGANTLPRPSNYSITTATGSKRSSADSDLLLCHVRLWQTSRFRFGCASVCEHSEIGLILIIPSAYRLNSRPPLFFQRACRQCVHESARLFRVICSHAWYD